MIFVKNKVLFGLETQCFCRQITCVVLNVHSSCRHYNRSGGTFMYCITHILTCTLSSFVIDQVDRAFHKSFHERHKKLVYHCKSKSIGRLREYDFQWILQIFPACDLILEGIFASGQEVWILLPPRGQPLTNFRLIISHIQIIVK